MSSTDFQTVQEAASRFGVTVRAVQKWAASGRIPGAEKIGRSWFIPRAAVLLDESPEKAPEPKIPNSVPDVYQLEPFREALPLMNARFPVGRLWRTTCATYPVVSSFGPAMCWRIKPIWRRITAAALP